MTFRKKVLKSSLILAGLIISFFFVIFVIRFFSIAKIDDVNPYRLCEEKYLAKSDILMIVPFSANLSIASNDSWCSYILSLNKTIGMHGVYHTEKEFLYPRNEEYIRKGMEEFKKCFGFYPSIFEAPELVLSEENEAVLNSLNFTIINSYWNLFHKIYHCTDFDKKSWLVKQNNLNDIL
jgi:predicted deacetylase